MSKFKFYRRENCLYHPKMSFSKLKTPEIKRFSPTTQEKNSKLKEKTQNSRRKLKIQGENSKLKEKTQYSGISVAKKLTRSALKKSLM